MTRRVFAVAALVLALATGGCASIGPASVPRDRIDYIAGVAESWKEQTLLNIVRLRYADAPSFVDVSSLISAYAFQGQLAAGGQISSNLTNTIPSSLVTLGGNATYLDRPTITYTPVMGDKFAKSLLRPIPPSAIFELIQAGYQADSVLLMTTRAINGIYNRSNTGAQTRAADPQFYPLLEALRRLQFSGAVSMRLEKQGKDETGMLVFARRQTPQTQRDILFVEKTLGVTISAGGSLNLTFGALPRNDHEIAVLSRSMLEMLLEVAGGIVVPQKDIAQGRTVASTRPVDAPDPRDRPLVSILSGPAPPPDAFATAHYGGTWYWISDGDFRSKRAFTFLMLFFSLAETGVAAQAPVITVPAN